MKISVVIATYNSGQTLKRCLDSIISQLGDDGEIIIVDGASKDNTMEIVKSYNEKIAYSISEPDKGVYDAWNKGIKHAKGKFITFVGSDDSMLPDTFLKYKKFFETNGEDYDLICGKHHFIDKNGCLLKDVGEPWDWNKLIYRKWHLSHPGMLNHRRCFERIGNFDINFHICADSDFLLRLGPNIKTGFINDFLVNMSAGGISDSLSAIKEAYLTRKKNKVLNPVINYFGYLRSLFIFVISHMIHRHHA